MNIYGKKIMLRAIERKDHELITSMFNSPEIERLVIGWSFPLSQLAHEKWIEEHYKDDNLRLIIERLDSHEAVGVAMLTDIDWKNRKASYGIKIADKENRHQGLGIDTTMAFMRYAFDELQLNRLDSCCLEDNVLSKKMHMKCGWVEEGVRRNYIYKQGKYKDLIELGILAQDYYSLLESNNYWVNC